MAVFNDRGTAYFGHGGLSWSDSGVDAYADGSNGRYEKLYSGVFGRHLVYSRI